MAAFHYYAREIPNILMNKNGPVPDYHNQPSLIMNPTQPNDEPLKLHELVVATTLVVAACASIGIGFTMIAACQYVGDTLKRIHSKGGRHVPR